MFFESPLLYVCPTGCTYKTPTPEVIRRVEKLRAAESQKYARIYAEMNETAKRSIALLRDRDFSGFGQILNLNLMDDMGVNTPEL